MKSHTLSFIVFAFVTYLIATDESVAKAFYFVSRLIQNKFAIFYWWLANNPATPWARYSMWRRSNQLAKELMKEFQDKK